MTYEATRALVDAEGDNVIEAEGSQVFAFGLRVPETDERTIYFEGRER
jgi:hypothetical protein